MKQKMNLLAPGMLVLGLIGCALYRAVYTHLDAAQILVRGTLPEIALWVVTGAALLLALWGSKATLGKPYAPIYAVGDIAFAVGCFTVLRFAYKGPAILENVYHGTAILALVCLVAMAILHLLGKRPYAILQAGPCLFLLLQLVEAYQLWAEVPALLDYFFGVGAVICLLLFSYHRLAHAVELPESKFRAFTCLAGIFFCTVAAMQVEFPIFYASGVVWLMASATNSEE